MTEYLKDPDFRSFINREDEDFGEEMGGSFDSLDKDISELVYLLFKLPFLETQWSCSGHYGTSVQEWGKTNKPGYALYQEGFLKFTITQPNIQASDFLQDLYKVVEGYSFVTLNYSEEDDSFWLILEMKDLIEAKQADQNTIPPTEISQTEESTRTAITSMPGSSMSNIVSKRELPMEQAANRYAHFLKFWEDVKDLARRCLN
jgi:hypothetical protein